ncbi:MAG: hemolysin family protein [Alphaproteobacteria bacterium]|nr:hemolysin family protein [Alphaproteobacteria bacterium]
MADLPAEKPAEERKGKLLAWIKSLLPEKSSSDDSLREAIEELIEEEETAPQSAVAVHERRLISNILQLRDLPVVDVMVPRADIVAIDINTPQEELIRLLAEKPHSRIPVYKGDMDNIIGVAHIKDMVANIASGNSFELKDIIREALVVSPAMRVLDLLLQLRQSKVHIAFVVDEFGGIDGLITINDMIEAIVGEIDDEYEFEIEPQLIERPDGSAIADARYPIENFEARYGDLFHEDDEDEDVDTLGGLVTAIAGHVPGRGEIIRHSSGIEFEIIDADPRRVMRVRIRNLPKREAVATAHE